MQSIGDTLPGFRWWVVPNEPAHALTFVGAVTAFGTGTYTITAGGDYELACSTDGADVVTGEWPAEQTAEIQNLAWRLRRNGVAVMGGPFGVARTGAYLAGQEITVPVGDAHSIVIQVAAATTPGPDGPVATVAGVAPDDDGDVPLTAADVGAATPASVATAISAHVAATDPHGDRAYTDTAVAPTELTVPAGDTVTIDGGDLPDTITIGTGTDRATVIIDVTDTQPAEGQACRIVAQAGVERFGASLGIMHGDADTPGVLMLDGWFGAAFGLAYPLDLGAGVEFGFEVDGTPQTFTIAGTIADLNALLTALLTNLDGVSGAGGEQFYEVLARHTLSAFAFITDSTGAGSSIEVANPGAGDPFALSALVAAPDMDEGPSVPGVTDPHRGVADVIEGLGEIDGHAVTHTWPDTPHADPRAQCMEIVWTGGRFVYGKGAERAEMVTRGTSDVETDLTAVEAAVAALDGRLDTLEGAPADESPWTVLADGTPLGSAAAQVDIDITGYTSVRGMIVGRSDTTASGQAGLRARLNGDSGNNYSSSGGAATSFATLGNLPGSQTNTDRTGRHAFSMDRIAGGWTVGESRSVAPTSTATTAPSVNAASFAWMTSTTPTLLSLYLGAGSFAPGTRIYLEAR